MPYENVVALVLLGLVFLVPVLKWAKDRWMPSIQLEPGLWITVRDCHHLDDLKKVLGGRNELDFFAKHEPAIRGFLQKNRVSEFYYVLREGYLRGIRDREIDALRTRVEAEIQQIKDNCDFDCLANKAESAPNELNKQALARAFEGKSLSPQRQAEFARIMGLPTT